MTSTIQPDQPRARGRTPGILLGLAAVGAVQAAAWFYFRNRQPMTDAITCDRLQPRSKRP